MLMNQRKRKEDWNLAWVSVNEEDKKMLKIFWPYTLSDQGLEKRCGSYKTGPIMPLFNQFQIECSAIVLHVAVKWRFDARWSRTRAHDVNISDVDMWINSSLRILQKLFSSVLSIYSALCKNGSPAIFQAVKLFWLPSEKREIDVYISTWAFSCSFSLCLALLMLLSILYYLRREIENENDVLRKKIQSRPSRGFFFPKLEVLTDQSLVVSRFLDCSQSPVLIPVRSSRSSTLRYGRPSVALGTHETKMAAHTGSSRSWRKK